MNSPCYCRAPRSTTRRFSRARVFEPFDAGIGRMTFSAGVARLNVSEPTAEHLFHEADQSMYRVKRSGGEGIAVAVAV